MKRSQITIFIIFALTLIIAVWLVIHITNTGKESLFKPEELQNQIPAKDSANFFTQACLDNTLKAVLDKLGENGGYVYRKPELKIQSTQDYEFTFLYIDRHNFLPDLVHLQSDIEKYINDNLRYCLDDFADYEKQGWNIKIPEVKSKTTITENDVIVSVEFPAEFTRDKLSFKLDKFYTRNNLPLKKILNEAGNILNEAGNILKETEDAQKKIDNHKSPSIPPQSFTRNGLLLLNYQYPDTGRFLWIIKEKEYEFFFAVDIET